MKYIYVILSFIIPVCSVAQVNSDTANVRPGIATFTYYVPDLHRGSFAIGPTFVANCYDNLAFQISLLVDVNEKHYSYDNWSHGYTIYGGYTPEKHIHVFVPLLIHYHYLTRAKSKCFVTAGLYFSKNYFNNQYNEPTASDGLSMIGGTGFTYGFAKHFYLRGLLSVTYFKTIDEQSFFVPGCQVDVLF